MAKKRRLSVKEAHERLARIKGIEKTPLGKGQKENLLRRVGEERQSLEDLKLRLVERDKKKEATYRKKTGKKPEGSKRPYLLAKNSIELRLAKLELIGLIANGFSMRSKQVQKHLEKINELKENRKFLENPKEGFAKLAGKKKKS